MGMPEFITAFPARILWPQFPCFSLWLTLPLSPWFVGYLHHRFLCLTLPADFLGRIQNGSTVALPWVKPTSPQGAFIHIPRSKKRKTEGASQIQNPVLSYHPKLWDVSKVRDTNKRWVSNYRVANYILHEFLKWRNSTLTPLWNLHFGLHIPVCLSSEASAQTFILISGSMYFSNIVVVYLYFLSRGLSYR